MSARLTKAIRERMAKALVRHKLNDRANALTAESVAIFAATYDALYNAETQKLMAKLIKLHPKAFPTNTEMDVNAGGLWVRVGSASVGLYEVARWQAEIAARPIFDGSRVTAPEALSGRIREYAMATKTFAEDVKAAYNKALVTLNALGTAKRLQEEWPEAMPLIGSLIPATDRTVPVVQLAAINDEFGLPPSEKLAA